MSRLPQSSLCAAVEPGQSRRDARHLRSATADVDPGRAGPRAELQAALAESDPDRLVIVATTSYGASASATPSTAPATPTRISYSPARMPRTGRCATRTADARSSATGGGSRSGAGSCASNGALSAPRSAATRVRAHGEVMFVPIRDILGGPVDYTVTDAARVDPSASARAAGRGSCLRRVTLRITRHADPRVRHFRIVRHRGALPFRLDGPGVASVCRTSSGVCVNRVSLA